MMAAQFRLAFRRTERNGMFTKKSIVTVGLVVICAAGTMAIRDTMANSWTRAVVACLGGILIGIVIVLRRKKNQRPE